jgi:hypothetical protein
LQGMTIVRSTAFDAVGSTSISGPPPCLFMVYFELR